jgi:hypothetical protein
MDRRIVGIVSLFGIAVAVTLMGLQPVAAQAGITCAPGTTALVRAVGSQTAPMLVPAQVHATICSQNGSVVAIIPSFQTVGPSGAPMVVPTNMNIKTCVPTAIVITPTAGSGLSAPAQLVQVSPGVFAISTVSVVSPATPVVVTSVPTALTCF